MASSSRERGKQTVSGLALIPAGELSGKPPIPLSRPIIVVGSRESCRIRLISRTVSKAHALLVVTRHTVFVRDLASRDGTFVNGEKVGEHDLCDGDIVKFGRFEFIFSAGGAKLRPHREPTPEPAAVQQIGSDAPPVPLEGRVTLIGRRSVSDIPMLDEQVSTAHAVIVAWEGKRYIRDLGSRTGTFVNGQQVHQQEIHPADQIRVGRDELIYEVSTPGTGVEVVEAPTESAIGKAVSAQELIPVEPSGETLTPAEKPQVAEPESRAPRPSTPPGTLEPPTAVEVPAESLADVLTGETRGDSEDLSRRGWHRAGSIGEAIPVEQAPGAPDEAPASTPVEPAVPVEAAAEPEIPAPDVAQSPIPIVEAEAAPVAEPPAPIEPLVRPRPYPQPVARSVEEIVEQVLATGPPPGTPEIPHEPEIAEPPPAPILLQAAAEPAAPEIAAVEPLAPVEPAPAPLPAAGSEEIVAPEIIATAALPIEHDALAQEPEPPIPLSAGDHPPAEVDHPVEVLDTTEPSPESAQPLETVALESDDAIALHAPPVMTDSAFDREVRSLTESVTGEPIIVPPQHEPEAVRVPEPAPVELSGPAAPGPVDVDEAVPIELGATIAPPPEPAAEPATQTELALRATEEVAAPFTDPIDELEFPVGAPAPPAQSAASSVEPALPLTAPDPGAAADDHVEPEIAALPALGRTVRAADVTDEVVKPELPAPDLQFSQDQPGQTRPDSEAVEDLATVPLAAPPSQVEIPVPDAAASIALGPESLYPSADIEAVPHSSASDLPLPASTDADEPVHIDSPEDLPLTIPSPEPTSAAVSSSSLDLASTPEPAASTRVDTVSDLPLTETPAAMIAPLDEPPSTVDLQIAAALARTDEPAFEEEFKGGLLEVQPDASSETAFAVEVPKVATLSFTSTAPLETDETEPAPPPLVEPPTAPEPKPNISHDVGGMPIEGVQPQLSIPPEALAADLPAIGPDVSATIALPPPLPPDAPAVTQATDDDAPALYVPTKPRRPVVIKDAFNKRGTRQATEFTPEGSPFAGSRGNVPADPFGPAPADVSAESAMQFTSDASEADLTLELGEDETLKRRFEPGGAEFMQDMVTETPAPPHARPSRPPGPMPAIPSAALAGPPALSPEAQIDLHEIRRQKLRRIPVYFIATLLIAGLAVGGILWLVPVYSTFEASLKFKNLSAKTIADRNVFQKRQLDRVREESTRVAAIRELRLTHPELPAGFLSDRQRYYSARQLVADWPEHRADELVLRFVGSEKADKYRLQALLATMYSLNQDVIDASNSSRRTLGDLQDKVESNARKLADLKQQIERERMLAESCPTPQQLAEMEVKTSALEKTWSEALVKLKSAEAENTRLEKAIAAAKERPPGPPEDDKELKDLEKQLSDLQARYQAAQAPQTPQASSAREELDSAMESFEKQIEAARGQDGSPELARYIAAAENLQQMTRQLLDDLLARQQSQFQRLMELKAKMDEKSRQRIADLRNSDPQLSDMIARRESEMRRLNAAKGSDGQVSKEEIAGVEENLKLLDNMIKGREEVLSNDPLYAEAIATLQTIIDKQQAEMTTDRKSAEEKLDALQKQFAASTPAVAGLPEEQKKLAQEVQQQLATIAAARKRYSDVLDIDRQDAERDMKQMQAKIASLQTDIDARKKLLTEQFTTQSVAALTTALEAHGKVLADARSTESAARAAFEERSKALRNGKDMVAAVRVSDERLNRLINDRVETERVLQIYNDNLAHQQKQAAQLPEIEQPDDSAVAETRGDDPRLMFCLIALGVCLAGFGGLTWWTVHTAGDPRYFPEMPEMPTPKPLVEAIDSGSGPSMDPADADPEEHAPAV